MGRCISWTSSMDYPGFGPPERCCSSELCHQCMCCCSTLARGRWNVESLKWLRGWGTEGDGFRVQLTTYVICCTCLFIFAVVWECAEGWKVISFTNPFKPWFYCMHFLMYFIYQLSSHIFLQNLQDFPRKRWPLTCQAIALLNRKDVDKVSFTAAIGACGRAKHWSTALLLLKEAEAMSVDVSWPSFGEKWLQNSCQKIGKWNMWYKYVQITLKDVSECLHRYDKIWMKICRGCETSELVSPWITPWVYLGLDLGRLVQCSYGSPKEWVSAWILETFCVYDVIFENIWGKGELELP